jgi:hypothetical protein
MDLVHQKWRHQTTQRLSFRIVLCKHHAASHQVCLPLIRSPNPGRGLADLAEERADQDDDIVGDDGASYNAVLLIGRTAAPQSSRPWRQRMGWSVGYGMLPAASVRGEDLARLVFSHLRVCCIFCLTLCGPTIAPRGPLTPSFRCASHTSRRWGSCRNFRVHPACPRPRTPSQALTPSLYTILLTTLRLLHRLYLNSLSCT